MENKNKKFLILLGLSIMVVFGSIRLFRAFSDDVPEINYVATSLQNQFPPTIGYISSSLSRGSSSSEVVGLKSIFQNTTDIPITAIGVTWTVLDQSGKSIRSSISQDKLFPFGEPIASYAPGSLIEIESVGGIIRTSTPVAHVDVQVDFVETSNGKVWPDEPSSSFHTIFNMRRGAFQFRRYLVSEFDRGGIARIEEIIQKEKSKIAAESATTAQQ